jgi:predicted neuraminidase
MDGRAWVLAQSLAHGSGADEYSYPALAWADDSLWVSYTDQRRSIAWQRFSFSPGAR